MTRITHSPNSASDSEGAPCDSSMAVPLKPSIPIFFRERGNMRGLHRKRVHSCSCFESKGLRQHRIKLRQFLSGGPCHLTLVARLMNPLRGLNLSLSHCLSPGRSPGRGQHAQQGRAKGFTWELAPIQGRRPCPCVSGVLPRRLHLLG